MKVPNFREVDTCFECCNFVEDLEGNERYFDSAEYKCKIHPEIKHSIYYPSLYDIPSQFQKDKITFLNICDDFSPKKKK